MIYHIVACMVSYIIIFPYCPSYGIHRIDAEASILKEKLEGMEAGGELIGDGYETASKEATIATIEVKNLVLFC